MGQAETLPRRGWGSRRGQARSRRAALGAGIRAAARGLPRGRSRRVLLLLVLIWMLNGFDLAFTLLANEIGGFHEANPFARPFLRASESLIAFKLASVAVASAILIAFRRRVVTEVACWLLCVVYTVLAFMWVTYYSFLS